ncbi:MAG: nicotinate-nicotinamide nucleotide adenylyltransferase [Deltaproteobacteria bacterium]|nr:nicotinate-nicotinamide nucleotide adenylyltransferase [Deltaproteobacteria bacterium]
MKIALFGGAFDPPHRGHVGIVEHLLEKRFDQVWIIPCWRHPLGKKSLPFWKRFRLCRLAFRPFGKKVRLQDIERRLHLDRSWTVETLRYLCRKYPRQEWTLVIGEDNYQKRGEWRGFEEIEKRATLYRIPRGPSSSIPDVSSTEVRQKAALGRDLTGLVPDSVCRYLGQHSIY